MGRSTLFCRYVIKFYFFLKFLFFSLYFNGSNNGMGSQGDRDPMRGHGPFGWSVHAQKGATAQVLVREKWQDMGFLYFIAFSSSEHSLYKIINSKTLNKLFSQFLDNLIISKRNNSQISRYSSHLQRVAAHARSILWLWIGQVWAIGKALQYFTAFNQWIAWISKTPWCPFSGYNNLVSFYLQ